MKKVNVYQMSDYEFWVAHSKEEAIKDYIKTTGDNDIDYDFFPQKISSDDLEKNTLRRSEEDNSIITFKQGLKEHIEQKHEIPGFFAGVC